ncbi:hypothetical protein MYSTI_03413 [Myxococcus stipitatus DSM 14675]|uniref:Uncharacterized protein n=1 Tax=Myxococcus stipitatus (strain DSM 14675 / JCM 12634 / Mx s8) TaxID=1278073 RepID=L7UA17_MYXSD|nr:hypothetical protein [Myxococcus stipitatus]AGC44725.1 hypothetical protein MYSTI_03413 [Myxococcus stipitatus DSM 14675]
MTQRAHTFARGTATLLVVLWALQPLGTLLHVRDAHAHRFCPEHQTFEETAKGTGAIQARLAPEKQAQLYATVAGGTDPARLNHETCPLLTSGTRDELLFSAPSTWTLARLAVSSPTTAPPHVSPPLSVLDIAPKSSPPAHA